MSWLSDLLGIGGSIAGGISSLIGQRETNANNLNIAREANATNRGIANAANAANAKQVKDLMNWQTNMSNTSFQRQMADLKKAGINPMLAGIAGGASTPPGASIPATVGAGAVTGAPMQNEFSGVGPAVNSAVDALRAKYEIQNMKETAKNLQETNKKISSDTALNRALTTSAEKDAVLKANSAKIAAANAKLLDFQMPGAKTEADIDSSLFGKVMRYGGRLNPLTSMSHAAKNVVGLASGRSLFYSKKRKG